MPPNFLLRLYSNNCVLSRLDFHSPNCYSNDIPNYQWRSQGQYIGSDKGVATSSSGGGNIFDFGDNIPAGNPIGGRCKPQ